jgi:hypothetical protein
LLGSFIALEDALNLSSSCGPMESSAFSKNKQNSSDMAILMPSGEIYEINS